MQPLFRRELYCLDAHVLNTIEQELNTTGASQNLNYLLSVFSMNIDHPFLRQEPLKGLTCAYLMEKAIQKNSVDFELAKRVHRQFQIHGVYA